MLFDHIVPEAVQALCIYDSLKKHPLLRLFQRFCTSMQRKKSFEKLVDRYTSFCSALYRSEFQGNLTDAVLDLILSDRNPFSESAAVSCFEQIPAMFVTTAKQDLQTLYQIATLPSSLLKEELRKCYPDHSSTIDCLPEYRTVQSIHRNCVVWTPSVIAKYHRQNGTGSFSKYRAFSFSNTQQLVPIPNPKQVFLKELKKYEIQKQRIVDNTKSFLAGKPASNTLLYGDRGTGKSTMVHAILSEYGSLGLRMIQITKEDVLYLNELIAQIRNVPLYFILFIDDLTFEESDAAFNTLKAILEGSLNALPKNVLIYATTNRRHLIKETFSAREGNELHASDTRDESASLADRFGLCLTFMKPTLPEYLEIVCAIANDRGIHLEEERLKAKASTFATRKGSRSGRVARQFIDEIESRIALQLPL